MMRDMNGTNLATWFVGVSETEVFACFGRILLVSIWLCIFLVGILQLFVCVNHELPLLVTCQLLIEYPGRLVTGQWIWTLRERDKREKLKALSMLCQLLSSRMKFEPHLLSFTEAYL